MKQLIRLTESDLNDIVKNVVTRLISEGLDEKVDMGLLGSVEYVDNATVRSIIEKMIPADNRKMNGTEYQPIRQLVMYFDPKNGIARHGSAMDRKIAAYIMGMGSMLGNKNKHSIEEEYRTLCKEDKELVDCIYGTVRQETRRGVVNTKLQGSELIRQVGWHIQTILNTVQKMIVKIQQSDVMSYFSDAQGMKGAETGKIKGLINIVLDANDNLGKIQSVMDNLEKLSRKGNDPLAYNTYRRR